MGWSTEFFGSHEKYAKSSLRSFSPLYFFCLFWRERERERKDSFLSQRGRLAMANLCQTILDFCFVLSKNIELIICFKFTLFLSTKKKKEKKTLIIDYSMLFWNSLIMAWFELSQQNVTIFGWIIVICSKIGCDVCKMYYIFGMLFFVFVHFFYLLLIENIVMFRIYGDYFVM